MNDLQKMIDLGIEKLQGARGLIAKSTDFGDLKTTRNEAEAIREFARMQGAGRHTVNEAADVKIRCERRLGQLLKTMTKQQGARNGKTESHDVTPLPPTLAEIGIEKMQSHRWQAIADVPDEEFEQVLARTKEDGDLTTGQFVKLGRHTQIEKERETWQSEEKFEGSATVVQLPALAYLAEIEPASIDLLLTDPPYSTDVEDIAAFARSWLGLALSRVKPTGRAYVFIGAYPAELYAYLDAVYRPRPMAEPHSMRLDMILPWVYRNTLGPATKDSYKLNWQACLYFIGPDAPALNGDILNEKFSVQDINAPDGRQGLRLHAWEKPAEIAERFIRHATEPGQTILDSFAGTGTFLAAAARLGRVGIGCEIEDEMLTFCRQRGIA